MNIPGLKSMIGELSVLYSIGVAAAKIEEVEPHTHVIRENITTGKQILEFIGEIPEWANYERNLRAYLESLNRKKTQLRCMESDLTNEVDIIERQNNGKRKREVENWLRNVRAKADDADRTEEEMERQNFVFRFLFRAWLGKCVKTEEEDVDELIKQREVLGSGLGLVLEPNKGTIQYVLVTSVLVGKASSEKRLSIWTMLLNRTSGTLGILGGRGMGKTTMMANIYNLEVAYSGLFERAFYVNIRERVDLHQLQAAIGEAMNLCDLASIKDPSRRASRIKTALDKCGKFLLILDGLCEYFRLTEVGIPIEEGGGKLVVVSRYRNVCQKACEKVITLERIPENDAEELFMKTLRSPAQLSQDIQEIASEIIRQCEGVPSMIVKTAESLRGVDDIHEWREKSRELSMTMIIT